MATQVVRRELGDKANGLDDEVLQYIASTIEEEEGEAGVDAASPLLEEFGAANSEQEAISLARQLAQKLRTADGEGRQEAPSEPKQLNEAKAIGGLTKEEQGEYRAPKGAIASIENHRESEGKHSKGRRRDERAAALVTERNLRAAKESEREAKPVVVRDVGSGGGSRDIKLERVTVTAAGRELIQDAQVVLSRGRRYGLVGRNGEGLSLSLSLSCWPHSPCLTTLCLIGVGTGKTTLLRQIAHRQVEGLPPNAQARALSHLVFFFFFFCGNHSAIAALLGATDEACGREQVLHVEQEVVGDETTAMEAVLECDTERNELLEEERRLQDEGEGGENAQRLAQIYKRLDEIDAYSAEARASTILSGLSFSPDMQRSPTKVFSGGWRMRIALARALFVQPDILLLDEPTNHLVRLPSSEHRPYLSPLLVLSQACFGWQDLHAVLWLEDCLQRWPTTLVIVSHAREFLNSVCTDIIHLHSRTLTAYRGNYDDFERTFSEMKRQREKQQEAQDRRRRQMQQFIDKVRGPLGARHIGREGTSEHSRFLLPSSSGATRSGLASCKAASKRWRRWWRSRASRKTPNTCSGAGGCHCASCMQTKLLELPPLCASFVVQVPRPRG